MPFHNGQWYDETGARVGAPGRLRGGITLTASGQTVVAAVAGKKIRVFAAFANAGVATNVKFQTGSGGDLTGTLYHADKGGAVLPQVEDGWFETLPGEALILNMTVNTSVGVQVIYALV